MIAFAVVVINLVAALVVVVVVVVLLLSAFRSLSVGTWYKLVCFLYAMFNMVFSYVCVKVQGVLWVFRVKVFSSVFRFLRV